MQVALKMLAILFLILSVVCLTIADKPRPYSVENSAEFGPKSGLSNEECVRRIYRDCNYPTAFTDEELENVRQFFNYSFTVLADIKPDKPLCPKIHVRQDWKCLSHQQRMRTINVWKEMYERGLIQRLADIHSEYWPSWHKTPEFGPAHRWITNEFDRTMRSIDPKTALPYWDPYSYGFQPERSSVWDVLGHSGNYSNGYAVPDGIYAEWGLIPSIKRHWSPRKTIYPWFSHETVANYIQDSPSFSILSMKRLGIHFPPHLNVGGYEGQYSVRGAPYDCLFYMHHSVTDTQVLKWQLLKKTYLTPLSYNNIRFNPRTGVVEENNIYTDTLNGVPWVTIRETFWVGFGDYCSVHDQLVRPINNLMKGLQDPIPTAIKRFPKWILEKYFPSFRSANFSAIFHTLEEVGECNTGCLPLPKPTFMRETEAGRNQFEGFVYDEGFDQMGQVVYNENYYQQMWYDLNRSGYCSPYVTTY